ncbi:MAG: hypothetical protein AAF492_23105 [Verrucomicrobiota bacterium]
MMKNTTALSLLFLLFVSSASAQSTIGIRLNTIMMPDLNFRNRTVQEICDFLMAKSRDLDPEGIGVNIILMTDKKNEKVTWSLKSTSVKRVIELLVATADLDYVVDRNAVVIKTPAHVLKKRAAAQKKRKR